MARSAAGSPTSSPPVHETKTSRERARAPILQDRQQQGQAAAVDADRPRRGDPAAAPPTRAWISTRPSAPLARDAVTALPGNPGAAPRAAPPTHWEAPRGPPPSCRRAQSRRPARNGSSSHAAAGATSRGPPRSTRRRPRGARATSGRRATRPWSRARRAAPGRRGTSRSGSAPTPRREPARPCPGRTSGTAPGRPDGIDDDDGGSARLRLGDDRDVRFREDEQPFLVVQGSPRNLIWCSDSSPEL
jgi:hypothetical protein